MVLCQYSLCRFPSSFLLEVLMTHPLALIDCSLFHNVYFIPLEEFFALDFASVQLKRWIYNLKVIDLILINIIYMLLSCHLVLRGT